MAKIFIDGSAGTTGLRIRERLASRRDLEIATLPDELRKDPAARAGAIDSADVAFLCLPDAAAVEAVSLVPGTSATIIDTSTAHRTAPGWTYGMPELPGMRRRIRESRRIANPGCHASGFILLVAPLVEAGIVPRSSALCAFSLTGYTGGGKKMIAEYEDAAGRPPLLDSPRQYGLTQFHKHLPEMVKYSGLDLAPAFCPVVADFTSGMEVTVPLFARDISGTAGDIAAAYRAAYPAGGVVTFAGDESEGGFLAASALAGSDAMRITIHGNAERIILAARYDNLGKGASGAAIQNMNIALGLPECEGLLL